MRRSDAPARGGVHDGRGGDPDQRRRVGPPPGHEGREDDPPPRPRRVRDRVRPVPLADSRAFDASSPPPRSSAPAAWVSQPLRPAEHRDDHFALVHSLINCAFDASTATLTALELMHRAGAAIPHLFAGWAAGLRALRRGRLGRPPRTATKKRTADPEEEASVAAEARAAEESRKGSRGKGPRGGPRRGSRRGRGPRRKRIRGRREGRQARVRLASVWTRAANPSARRSGPPRSRGSGPGRCSPSTARCSSWVPSPSRCSRAAIPPRARARTPSPSSASSTR